MRGRANEIRECVVPPKPIPLLDADPIVYDARKLFEQRAFVRRINEPIAIISLRPSEQRECTLVRQKIIEWRYTQMWHQPKHLHTGGASRFSQHQTKSALFCIDLLMPSMLLISNGTPPPCSTSVLAKLDSESTKIPGKRLQCLASTPPCQQVPGPNTRRCCYVRTSHAFLVCAQHICILCWK